jgi:HK97 family phage prohead protease
MIVLRGYIVVWNDLAEVEGVLESFSPYSFAEPLLAHMTAAHLPGHVYARTASGQLHLEQDDTGLRLEVDVGEDREWRRLIRAIQAGMRGMSFTFREIAAERAGGRVMVTRAKLSEVCVTGSPAYAGGAIWFDGEDGLPPHLAALREAWHARSVAGRPARIEQEVAAFERTRATVLAEIEPVPALLSVQVDDPIRRRARAYLRQRVGQRA